MAEESFQEALILHKDGKTRSVLNSLYNVYYYGMEALLLNQDIHCRNHDQLRTAFCEKFLQNHLFGMNDRSDSNFWQKEIEMIFKVKDENDKGFLPSGLEVQRLIRTGSNFLNSVKKYLAI